MTVAPPILFADLDGTVRHGYVELGRFVNTADDVYIFTDVHKRVAEWHSAGGVVIGVTNQAGVSLGYISEWEHRLICEVTQQRARLDHIVACIHAPTDGCFCRKPQPGLIYEAVGWVRYRHGAVPPRGACAFVGDRDEDEQAASRAGITFLPAKQWRDAV